MKIGFVILHYLTDNDTVECVESIEKVCKKSDYHIVIVDNFSNNGSIEKLEKDFSNEKKIHIIKNKENLGFARGNNVGYEYCRDTLKCDVITVCNNDTILLDKNFGNHIIDDIKKYDVGVIGPDIESAIDHGHQNPMSSNTLKNIDDIKKEIRKYKILLYLEKIHIYNLVRYIFRKKQTAPHQKGENAISNAIIGAQLHGSFLIFTKGYIEKYKEAFDNRTFLYMEEVILKERCDRDDIVLLFDPKIKVLHKEDSSTNILNSTTHSKRIFIFKNMIKSLKVVLEIKSGRGKAE